MKFLYHLGLLLSAAAAPNNLTLEEVFGHGKIPKLPTLEEAFKSGKVLPTKMLAKPITQRSAAYTQRRTPDNCTFPLEIMILQDNTASFQHDFYQMRDIQLDLMVSALSAGHPDSRFGVISFRDIPIDSLGEPNAGDYCLKLEQPLSTNVTALKAVYETLYSNGGADPAEAQFTAIVAAAQASAPGWSALPDSGVTRLIVVSTDSPPHFEGDGLNQYGLAPFSGTYDEAHPTAQCTREYYPSADQVRSALEARDAYLAVLVYDGAWWSELPSKSWTWFNQFIGQPAGFVNTLAADSSNFWVDLNNAITAIEELECVYPEPTPAPVATTTVPAATTTAAATVPATTAGPIPTITPVGTPVNTPPTSPSGPCPPCPPCVEEPCHCACPAVQIRLQDRPSHLRLEVDNVKVI